NAPSHPKRRSRRGVHTPAHLRRSVRLKAFAYPGQWQGRRGPWRRLYSGAPVAEGPRDSAFGSAVACYRARFQLGDATRGPKALREELRVERTTMALVRGSSVAFATAALLVLGGCGHGSDGPKPYSVVGGGVLGRGRSAPPPVAATVAIVV